MSIVMPEAVLGVRNLVIDAIRGEGRVRLVDGVSFDVMPNEVFAVVGESGSGKSITMLAVMGLLAAGRVEIAHGEILLQGRNLVGLPQRELRAVRGRDLAMIFQDPMTSLNPVMTIGSQIAEMIRIHKPGMAERKLRDRVIELLTLVGVPNPERRTRQYPHEFSGGMRQRAMIAMAIANEPALLIADEPTTALDVTIQAQVMDVLAEVRARTGASMILITHDLGLVAETSDRVAVMYGGRLVESATAVDLFAAQRHPYTAGLLGSLPQLHSSGGELYSIPGQPPSLANRPSGCIFNPRCGLKQNREICAQATPPLVEVQPAHHAACHFSADVPVWSKQVALEHASTPAMETVT